MNTPTSTPAQPIPQTIRRRHLIGLALIGIFMVGCSFSDGTVATGDGTNSANTNDAVQSSEGFAGYRVTPFTNVGDIELPEITNGDKPSSLSAAPGHVRVVYFGYTNCPDYCPTTMSDLKTARNRLKNPELIQPTMVTIDPERDGPILEKYVTAFFEDGAAFVTEDEKLLRSITEPIGVTYSIEPNPEAESDPQAEPYLVSHSTSLYAIDDKGDVILTWPFGVSIDDLEADLNKLIDEAAQ